MWDCTKSIKNKVTWTLVSVGFTKAELNWHERREIILKICFQDFKFRQVLWSFFCGPKPRFLRNNTQSYKFTPKVGKGDNGVSNHVAASNFTNMVDVTTHDSQDSENKVLQTDL